MRSGKPSNRFRPSSIPNLLSLARMPLAVLFPLTVRRSGRALAVLALAAATDVMDGWYARRFHQETAAGAVLDGIMDKTFVSAAVVTLIARGRLTPAEGAVMGIRELGELSLVVRWLGSGSGRRARQSRSANRMGKLATTAQFGALAALLWGTRHRRAWVALTGACGALSVLSYIVREARADHGAAGGPLASGDHWMSVLSTVQSGDV